MSDAKAAAVARAAELVQDDPALRWTLNQHRDELVELSLVSNTKIVPEDLLGDEAALKWTINQQQRELDLHLVKNRLTPWGDAKVTAERRYGAARPLPRTWWQRLLRRPVRHEPGPLLGVELRIVVQAVPSDVLP